MGRPSKYSPELHERAVRMVFEHAPEYPSQFAAMRSIAAKVGGASRRKRPTRLRSRDTGSSPTHGDRRVGVRRQPYRPEPRFSASRNASGSAGLRSTL
jgi:transposase-like protein